ncbi:gliding motility-associated C-terminal domain-containing protein [Mucilaginibacter pedocola]|nr:gliding motility-associated C-terminal domain-containing protein [Mucilaginibacter pedocola]
MSARIIDIANSTRVEIKNNLVQGGRVYVELTDEVRVQGNIAGFVPDGITSFKSSIELVDVKSSIIGGSSTTGNLVSETIDIKSYTLTGPWGYDISFNKVGVDYTGASSSPNLYTEKRRISADVQNTVALTGTITGTIRENVAGNNSSVVIYASGNGTVEISGNSIGIDKSGTVAFQDFYPDWVKSNPPATTGIVIESGMKALIQQNTIAYVANGILEQLANEVTITQNSIFCLQKYYNYNIHDFIAYPKTLPFVKINPYTNNSISGRATAGARVELFSNEGETCAGCGAKRFLTAVNADAQGNWAYSGILPGTIVASALSNNQTSLFTKPELDLTNITVTQMDCDGALGKITGAKFYNAAAVKWMDENGNVVSTSIDAEGLPAGKYKLVVGTDGCNAVSQEIEIIDPRPRIDASKIVIVRAGCNQLGSVKGITASANAGDLLTFVWFNENQIPVSSDLDATDLPFGEYTLRVTNETTQCIARYGPVILANDNPLSINDASPTITPSKCYEKTGSITGITATGTGTIKYSWRGDSNLEVGTDRDLINQPPGKYMLMVTDDSNCGYLFSKEHVIPAIPNDIAIDISTRTVTDATCDNANGSIKNITVTPDVPGALYIWANERNDIVGYGKDLSGVIAGTYTLTIYGSSVCEPVISQPITIQSTNGVSLDYSKQGGVSPSCNRSDGSITGLQAPGATTYNWVITGTNTTVGQNLDLTGVPAGFYTLTISNGICSRSYPFEVQGFPPTAFTGITYTKTKTCDAFPTGTITLNTDNANEEPRAYQWYDEQGNPVGYTKQVQFLKAGRYKLVLEDKNYCLFDYPEVFTIEAYPELKVTRGTETHIQCGVGTGSVTATTVTGGTGTYIYQWKNADTGQELPGKTQASIEGLAAGNYILEIKDDGGCNNFPIPYTIVDQPATPPTPVADDIQVYGVGKATIKVKDAFPTAIYRIYESATNPLPIKDTIGGDININVNESRSYYISLTYGYCESARAEVKVFLSALSGGVPNTFTPNGDGVNDLWNIPGLGSYPSATVNIFNRNGQSVYQSVGYAKPFDGTRNGKQLPTGVYYYIITLRKGEVLSGYVTILR